MSNLISHPLALPSFSILAACTLITVHSTLGRWREAPVLSNGKGFEGTIDTDREETGGDYVIEGVRPFTYLPTSSPMENNEFYVPVPTSIVFGHYVPPPETTPSSGNDRTPSIKWDIPLGEPTPDPALLYDPLTPPMLINKEERGEGQHGSIPPAYSQPGGSKLNPLWTIPFGQPTPDPALFLDPATPPSLKNHIGTQEPVKLDNPSEKTATDQEKWDPSSLENQENPSIFAPYPRPLEIGTLSPSNPGSQTKFPVLSSRSPLLITESIDTKPTKKHAIPTSTSQEKQKQKQNHFLSSQQPSIDILLFHSSSAPSWPLPVRTPISAFPPQYPVPPSYPSLTVIPVSPLLSTIPPISARGPVTSPSSFSSSQPLSASQPTYHPPHYQDPSQSASLTLPPLFIPAPSTSLTSLTTTNPLFLVSYSPTKFIPSPISPQSHQSPPTKNVPLPSLAIIPSYVTTQKPFITSSQLSIPKPTATSSQLRIPSKSDSPPINLASSPYVTPPMLLVPSPKTSSIPISVRAPVSSSLSGTQRIPGLIKGDGSWSPSSSGGWISGGSGGNPQMTPLESEHIPIPHNQKFLEGCDPLLCYLNEAADFHSMSNEDEAVYEIFYTNPIKCCRVVVEIGVGDGDRYSFSRFFEDGLKWKALLIEANPDMYQQLSVNRPNATNVHGAFCESGKLLYRNNAFSSLGGSTEVTSEVYTPLKAGESTKEVPCLSMDAVFENHGITKVDVMVVRLQGDALAFIRAMDWTIRVDVWVVLMHGASKQQRDELVRKVLKGNEYVQAEWDVKRWCSENGHCLKNEIFLRKGFNPLPNDFYSKLTMGKVIPVRHLRGKK